MESIFFEQQEAALCAQHALNMLLQGAYFSAVDLAEIAREMDNRENNVLGVHVEQSQNMDDSGRFSVQVMAEALRVFNLELIPWTSPRAMPYRDDPTIARAYICNLNEHWFAVRRFGFQWFTLNSLRESPTLISDTYLSLFFAQLANDGYSIFVVEGVLPVCPADEILSQCPVDPSVVKQNEPVWKENKVQEDAELAEAIALSLSQESNLKGHADHDTKRAVEYSKKLDEENDPTLQQVLKESMKDVHAGPYVVESDDEEMDRQLQRALQMSLENNSQSEEVNEFSAKTETPQTALSAGSPSTSTSCNAAEVRMKREQFLKRFE